MGIYGLVRDELRRRRKRLGVGEAAAVESAAAVTAAGPGSSGPVGIAAPPSIGPVPFIGQLTPAHFDAAAAHAAAFPAGPSPALSGQWGVVVKPGVEAAPIVDEHFTANLGVLSSSGFVVVGGSVVQIDDGARLEYESAYSRITATMGASAFGAAGRLDLRILRGGNPNRITVVWDASGVAVTEYVGGSNMGSDSDFNQSVGAGDVIEAEITGGNVVAKLNGTALVTLALSSAAAVDEAQWRGVTNTVHLDRVRLFS